MFYGSRRSHPNPLFIGLSVCTSSYYLSIFFLYEAPEAAEFLLLRKVLHLFPRHPAHGPYSASWVSPLQQTIFLQKYLGRNLTPPLGPGPSWTSKYSCQVSFITPRVPQGWTCSVLQFSKNPAGEGELRVHSHRHPSGWSFIA